MTPGFEWMAAKVKSSDGEDMVQMYYLVDACGQIRADIECPSAAGRPTYIADIYWVDEGPRYSHWVSLSLAKAKIETAYVDHLKHIAKRPRKVKK